MKRIIAVTITIIWVELILISCTQHQFDEPTSEDERSTKQTQEVKSKDKSQRELTHAAQSIKSFVEHSEKLGISASRIAAEASVLPTAPPIATASPQMNRENYSHLVENRVVRTELQPVSTFSVDVDTAAYANIRRYIREGFLPPKDAVRVEEVINYFDYQYSDVDTTQKKPFRWHVELNQSPWNANTHLLHLGLQAKRISAVTKQKKNLVFLVDVSGSMRDQNKLPLVQRSIKLMLNHLSASDRLSIVTYASGSKVLLPPTAVSEREKIIAAIDKLVAAGSTNGASGIQNAYALAQQSYIDGGNNRVLIATDGDFNMGVTDHDQLIELIKNYRENGIYLTTLGYGQGNYNDHLMEDLAQHGNGHYAYIDSVAEAKRVLVDRALSNFNTIARDVKVQIEFNPAVVRDYRLIGYENRILPEEAFNNDRIDAAEMGAGHSVTAMYEVTLGETGNQGQLDERRYQPKQVTTNYLDELGELKLAYKLPNEETSKKISTIITRNVFSEEPSSIYQMVVAATSFGLWLQQSDYLIDFDQQKMLNWVRVASANSRIEKANEFAELVDLAVAIKKSD